MAEHEKPREWTLRVCPDCGNETTGFSLCEHQKGGDGPTGIDFDKIVPVRVIEAEPVEREREEMLDLIERLSGWEIKTTGTQILEGVLAAQDILRRSGRLVRDTERPEPREWTLVNNTGREVQEADGPAIEPGDSVRVREVVQVPEQEHKR
jgi:hypothetical protein